MASQVPLKYVKSMLRLATASADELRPELEALGIDTTILLDSAPAGAGLSTEEYGRLFMHLIRKMQPGLTSSPGELNSLLEFSTYRMMYQAMVHAPNLREALRRAAAYFQRFQPNGETFHLEPSAELVSLRFDSHSDHGNTLVSASNFCMGQLHWLPGVTGQLLAISNWHRTASWCIGNYIDLERVELPADGRLNKTYLDLFGVPVQFGAAQAAFYFQPRYLDFPIVQNEASLEEMLDSFPARLLELDELKLSLSNRVRGLIGTNFSQEMPTLPDIAQRLCMTTTTLHRHLKSEGFSWQRIKDEARRDAAIDYLHSAKYSGAEVAELLGFSDISAFHRAFKKWTGKTPQQFRDSHQR
jgi:AraC-like DNA-binding protein